MSSISVAFCLFRVFYSSSNAIENSVVDFLRGGRGGDRQILGSVAKENFLGASVGVASESLKEK